VTDFLRYQPGLPETEYAKVVYFKPVSQRAKAFFQEKEHVVNALKSIFPDWYCFGWAGPASQISREISPPFTHEDVKDINGERPIHGLWR
jgi:hypothetical protein